MSKRPTLFELQSKFITDRTPHLFAPAIPKTFKWLQVTALPPFLCMRMIPVQAYRLDLSETGEWLDNYYELKAIADFVDLPNFLSLDFLTMLQERDPFGIFHIAHDGRLSIDVARKLNVKGPKIYASGRLFLSLLFCAGEKNSLLSAFLSAFTESSLDVLLTRPSSSPMKTLPPLDRRKSVQSVRDDRVEGRIAATEGGGDAKVELEPAVAVSEKKKVQKRVTFFYRLASSERFYPEKEISADSIADFERQWGTRRLFSTYDTVVKLDDLATLLWLNRSLITQARIDKFRIFETGLLEARFIHTSPPSEVVQFSDASVDRYGLAAESAGWIDHIAYIYLLGYLEQKEALIFCDEDDEQWQEFARSTDINFDFGAFIDARAIPAPQPTRRKYKKRRRLNSDGDDDGDDTAADGTERECEDQSGERDHSSASHSASGEGSPPIGTNTASLLAAAQAESGQASPARLFKLPLPPTRALPLPPLPLLSLLSKQ